MTTNQSNNKPVNMISAGVKKIVKDRSFGLFLAVVALIVLAAFLTPDLLQFNALNSMLQNNAILGIMAIGMLMVLVTRGIDLSVAATMVFSGMVISMLNADYPNIPVIFLVLLGILLGLLIGALNGVLISKLKLLPIIATLGTLYIVRGLTYVISDSRWIVPGNYSDKYKAYAAGNVFGINNLVWTAIIFFAIFFFILAYTRFGRRVFAVGSSPKSAQVTGIDNDKIILLVYLIMGGISGFAGFLYTSNYAIAQSTMAMGMEMDVIAICILGGVSITGGTGKISGIVISTVLFAIISSFLSMLSGLSIWTDAIKGVIIVGAVILNIYTTRSTKKHALRQRNI